MQVKMVTVLIWGHKWVLARAKHHSNTLCIWAVCFSVVFTYLFCKFTAFFVLRFFVLLFAVFLRCCFGRCCAFFPPFPPLFLLFVHCICNDLSFYHSTVFFLLLFVFF